ncbi:hypothetical protein [Roseisolibacter agri]|uniref:Lipoprotein n=1 Tax=Roseisolibacter agri TaxID=2014610 RepID=A0AA37Q4Q6_9BACT|nr:hypothetical protein [Roseisolibacter agri]GLC26555.1 hypothetical protein rosag_30680 [Roseisolibacter agri]
MIKRLAMLPLFALALAACNESTPTGPTPTSGPRFVEATSTERDGGLHFVGVPDLTVETGDGGVYLQSTGEVAGAGKTATARLSAEVSVLSGCLNRGSKNQEPSGLDRSTSQTAGEVTFNTRSGRGTFTVETEPVSGRSCPDTMDPVVISATFTNVVLTVTSSSKTTTAYFEDISWP